MKYSTIKIVGKYIIPGIAAISLLFNIFFGYRLFYSRDTTVETQNLASLPKNVTMNTVQRIIDGDTFDIENGERIQLYGIDAPEYPKGCMGEDVKRGGIWLF